MTTSCWLVASLVDGKVSEVWLRGPAAPWAGSRFRGQIDAAVYEFRGGSFADASESAVKALALYESRPELLDPWASLRPFFDDSLRAAIARKVQR